MLKFLGFVTIAAMLAAYPIAVFAQGNSSAMDLLVQRIADNSAFVPAAHVTVGTLPPDWKSPVPLPSDVPVLGSVVNPAQGNVTIYYRPADAQRSYEAYLSQLRSSGFAAAPVNFQFGGFRNSGVNAPRFTTFCRGIQAVSIVVAANSTDDLRITIPQANDWGGLCESRTSGLVSPLPSFVAPPGTTIMGTGGGAGFSTGFAAEPVGTASSSALITGKVALRPIFDSFLTQLRSAGWRITTTVASKDAAIAAFRRDRGAFHWRGSLAVYRRGRPGAYAARVDASGGAITREQFATPTAEKLPWIPVRIRKSDEPALLELTRRLATSGGTQEAQVYLVQTPPGVGEWGLPLPSATPLASTVAEPNYSSGGPLYNIYYTLTDSDLQSYFARLQASGFARQPVPGASMGGFENPYFAGNAGFCEKSVGLINVHTMPNSNAITLSVQPSKQTVCNTMQPPFITPTMFPHSPLPVLTPPDGVTMRPASPGVPGGTSGAVFVTTLPLSQLLDAFSVQLAKAGWTAGAASVGADVGSRSYSFADSQGRHWQAVLTLYRSDVHSDRYYAYIDVTNVSADGAGL